MKASIVCKNCGAELPPSAKFCVSCGSKLAAESDDNDFSLGEAKGDSDAEGFAMLEDVYQRLVAKKPASFSSYEEFYKTTADVFDVAALPLFKAPTAEGMQRLTAWSDRLCALAEKCWLRSDEARLVAIKDALGSLLAFFRYYEKKGYGAALEAYLLGKLQLLIDDKAFDGFISTEEFSRIMQSAKKLRLWDENTPEREKLIAEKISAYCKEIGCAIGAAQSESVQPTGKEFVLVEGKGRIKDFYLAKYVVTQKLYESVMGQNPSLSKGAGKPVESVSWYDAVTFCNKLSEKEGKTPCYRIDGRNTHCDKNADGYKIPTEEEWEYAARGGKEQDSFRYAGSDAADEVAWYKDNSSGDVHAVGQKKANRLGLYDMSGNVREWCWDSAFGGKRCLCGGSWSDDRDSCQVESDESALPEAKSRSAGFRLLYSRI